MSDDNGTFGYLLNALERQSKAVTTQGVTEKIFGALIVGLTGWCVHLTRKVARLERKLEKTEKKRTEE